MDHLAESRAKACVDTLVAMGVERSRLRVTFEGMGGHVRVDFIPGGPMLSSHIPSTAEYVRDDSRERRLEDDKRQLYLEIERLKRLQGENNADAHEVGGGTNR